MNARVPKIILAVWATSLAVARWPIAIGGDLSGQPGGSRVAPTDRFPGGAGASDPENAGIDVLGGHTFIGTHLGYPVSAWFPVDLNGDGTWALAITTADPTLRVGVFDPKSRSWIDGPRALAPGAQEWGVADYDDDGHLEYAYRKSDTIRFLDPDAGLDSVLWAIPFSSIAGAIFWGSTTSGGKCVAINEYHDSSWTHPAPGGTIFERQFYWTLHIYRVMSGALVRTVPGGPSSWHVIYGFPGKSSTSLAVHSETFYRLDGPPSMASRSEKIALYDALWDSVGLIPVKSLSFQGDLPVSYKMDNLAINSPFNSHRTFALSQFSVFVLGAVEPMQLRSREEAAPAGSWIMTNDWTGSYVGAVAFDLEQTGVVRWILPLSDSQGWERRDLTTGELADTLEGMPKCDLRTGALFTAGQPNLFYLADSTLYVWSDTAADIHDGDDNVDDEGGHWIRAMPNPFVDAVALSWPEESPPTSLQIVNVLGQIVYSRDFRVGENVTGLTWDAVGGKGHLAPGVYFARLRTSSGSHAVKLVLIR